MPTNESKLLIIWWFESSGILCCVIRWVISDVSKGCGTFVF